MIVITMLSMLAGERFQDGFMAKGHRMRVFMLFDDADSMRAFLIYLREEGIEISDFENAQMVGHCVSANFVLKIHGRGRKNHEETLRMLEKRPGVAFLYEV